MCVCEFAVLDVLQSQLLDTHTSTDLKKNMCWFTVVFLSLLVRLCVCVCLSRALFFVCRLCRIEKCSHCSPNILYILDVRLLYRNRTPKTKLITNQTTLAVYESVKSSPVRNTSPIILHIYVARERRRANVCGVRSLDWKTLYKCLVLCVCVWVCV